MNHSALNDPAKVYAAFYDGHSSWSCAGATSPALPMLGAVYLRACGPEFRNGHGQTRLFRLDHGERPRGCHEQPGGIDCPGSCTAMFQRAVTLTATPFAGATFRGWTGACSGTATCVVAGAGSASASFSSSSHRRTLTLRVRAQRAAGALRVSDGYEQCRVRASVMIERRGKQGWSIIRRTRTDGAGLFTVSIPRGRAAYRARAPETTANGERCVTTVSRSVPTWADA